MEHDSAEPDPVLPLCWAAAGPPPAKPPPPPGLGGGGADTPLAAGSAPLAPVVPCDLLDDLLDLFADKVDGKDDPTFLGNAWGVATFANQVREEAALEEVVAREREAAAAAAAAEGVAAPAGAAGGSPKKRRGLFDAMDHLLRDAEVLGDFQTKLEAEYAAESLLFYRWEHAARPFCHIVCCHATWFRSLPPMAHTAQLTALPSSGPCPSPPLADFCPAWRQGNARVRLSHDEPSRRRRPHLAPRRRPLECRERRC